MNGENEISISLVERGKAGREKEEGEEDEVREGRRMWYTHAGSQRRHIGEEKIQDVKNNKKKEDREEKKNKVGNQSGKQNINWTPVD